MYHHNLAGTTTTTTLSTRCSATKRVPLSRRHVNRQPSSSLPQPTISWVVCFRSSWCQPPASLTTGFYPKHNLALNTSIAPLLGHSPNNVSSSTCYLSHFRVPFPPRHRCSYINLEDFHTTCYSALEPSTSNPTPLASILSLYSHVFIPKTKTPCLSSRYSASRC